MSITSLLCIKVMIHFFLGKIKAYNNKGVCFVSHFFLVTTDTKVETKNIKIPDIFYFLDASTIKQTITIFIK